ncbi:hypothetical protein KHA96_04690 [Bacillus sp. FJAT-49711]|uniref:alpha-glucuronidase family glycosyl hydrolase n=1 Tax=Bacillus sp. FJAT-49711 TaxID=2833585 RepID=UPI001BCA5405|nr:hypothetical protein [Bacillus sp. FJAT-49711]
MTNKEWYESNSSLCRSIAVLGNSHILQSTLFELIDGLQSMLGKELIIFKRTNEASIILGIYNDTDWQNDGIDTYKIDELNEEGNVIQSVNNGEFESLLLLGKSDKAVL